jgi:anti-sigma B factor antagonist
MKIDVKEYEDVTLLEVRGKLMGGPETISVHDKVKELVDKGKKNVIIDLSRVAWMNSSGLGTMMGCLTSLRNANGELKLCGVTEKVKSLFMITKLITIFETYETAKEALAATINAI